MSSRSLPLLFLLLLPACRTNESPEGQVNDLEITTQVLSGQVDTADTKAKAETIAELSPT